MAPHDIHQEFLDWLDSSAFTCLGARASLRQKTLVVRGYGRLNTPEATAELHRDLLGFIADALRETVDFASFAAIFDEPRNAGEEEFEKDLWGQLSLLHAADWPHYPWSHEYSADPGSSDFAFSVGGRPFFVAGMHPNSVRISRRFTRPVLVFNSHEQFRRLKADGRYYGLKHRIRERELKLQGSINPMLDDHGGSSEARQYSGRTVAEDWECPFRPIQGSVD